MKYLIVIVLVLALIWFVRNNRRADRPGVKPPKQPSLGDPQDMVRCPVCSLHLPRVDALPGGDGKLYCCADHRARDGNGSA